MLSLALTFAFSVAMLGLRSRRAGAPSFRHRAPVRAATAYVARPLRPRLAQLWLRLFWLPFWRAENVVGWQQSALLAAALVAAGAWMQALGMAWRAARWRWPRRP
ncbi:hypothetical protein LP420_21725 [Massilia sp. B-10]|nr:hypothetical protein LP420_21725 [Massilia sp. B-10]